MLCCDTRPRNVSAAQYLCETGEDKVRKQCISNSAQRSVVLAPVMVTTTPQRVNFVPVQLHWLGDHGFTGVRIPKERVGPSDRLEANCGIITIDDNALAPQSLS